MAIVHMTSLYIPMNIATSLVHLTTVATLAMNNNRAEPYIELTVAVNTASQRSAYL